MAMTPPAEGAVVDLWAMAAELERQFAGYKQRFPETRSSSYMDDDDDDAPEDAVGDGDVDGDGMSNGHVEEDEAGDGDGGVRGRMYEAYTRRRDERLRSMWRARMERKEAEVMALWARLRGGGPTDDDDDDDGCAAGEEAEEDGERRRSSDVAAPGRVSGKKHPRTRRSFSSANLTKSSSPNVGLRRAQSQEPLPPTGASRTHGHGHHRARAVNGAAPKRKGSAKENGSLRQAGPKPPRGGLPRGCSSGGMDAVVLPNASVAASASQRRSSEQAVASDRDDEAPKASLPSPFVVSSNGAPGAGTARASSPESECGSEVLNGAAEAEESGEDEAKNAVIDVERREGEKIVVQSLEAEAKLGNGEITSDSEIEPSYVFIKKKDEKPMRLSDALAGSDAEPHLEDKNGTGNADVEAIRTDDADTAAEIATTENAESSNEMSSFSGTGRSGRCSAPSSPPSCSSRAQSIERLLVEDAALLRKKREDRGANGGRSFQAVSTPGSAGRRASGAARTTSPSGTGIGFKKRFLSFGKKTRCSDGPTVIECTSPASVSSPVDHHRSARRRCRTADDAIRATMVGSSSDAAASDDTEQGYAASPQACSLQSLVAASPAMYELSEMVPQEKSPKSHRSFFSFRSFNCGRG